MLGHGGWAAFDLVVFSTMADANAVVDPAVSEQQPGDDLKAPPIGGRNSLPKNVAVANARKQEGNDLYKKKQIRQAILKYHEALMCLKASPKEEPSSDIKEQVARLRANCYNNLAACLLLQPKCDYHRVVEYSNNVLRVVPNNAKALYRKGVAQYHLKNYSLARQYLDDAKRHCKAIDEDIEKYIQLCKEATEKPAAEE